MRTRGGSRSAAWLGGLVRRRATRLIGVKSRMAHKRWPMLAALFAVEPQLEPRLEWPVRQR
jgi:hypothetical protein